MQQVQDQLPRGAAERGPEFVPFCAAEREQSALPHHAGSHHKGTLTAPYWMAAHEHRERRESAGGEGGDVLVTLRRSLL